MTQQARATFEIKSWDEKPYGEAAGSAKTTRASVAKAYHGEIEGEGALEYLMAYARDGSARFVGMERVVGRLGDRSGSFIFQHVGAFEGGVAKSVWSVVPGSGTGDLQGLRGEVSSALGHGSSYPVELTYELGST